METRTITQVKIYKLVLNNMTDPKIEYSSIAAIGYSKQDVIDFCESQKGPWQDDRWGKTFRQGSILEWFNPPSSYNEVGSFGHGVVDEWVGIDSLQEFIDNNRRLVIGNEILQHNE